MEIKVGRLCEAAGQIYPCERGRIEIVQFQSEYGCVIWCLSDGSSNFPFHDSLDSFYLIWWVLLSQVITTLTSCALKLYVLK